MNRDGAGDGLPLESSIPAMWSPPRAVGTLSEPAASSKPFNAIAAAETERCWVLLDSSDWHGRQQGGADQLQARCKVTRVFNQCQDVELVLPDGDRRHPPVQISKVKIYHAPEDKAPKESLEFSPILWVCTSKCYYAIIFFLPNFSAATP
ncbi:hypothetical protein PSTG_10853 [Puccinia striiformis f. sp. tritici PST-78]|uniref:Uncharacterized protein n=1 Tax=Puccinia striiformis f. sp. tritici PST-78 TaxID=1165861 RepID=A0A0L0V923_9BASI|nr:hypothetical protein PSTG_10853 [Puccinia striiformis f. sp. tritici PST-78]